ncbi:hypothetical protein [Nonomuraea sp. SBT364]|uniref:hypothetical protein n=1 Tax=Nonomuraea sp. SBT364 TaxID=1580530 RepID=UPI00069D012E|nr:hypothetical protein [Nonomuraea sp. SBT364]
MHLLCRYGAELALHVYEQGERVNAIDLHPFITVSVDSYPDITFLGSNKPTVCGAGTDDRDKVKMTLSEEMFSGKLDNAIKVTVDRDGVDVPSLVGEFAGDRVASRSQPLWSVHLAGTPERGPGRSPFGHVNKL